MKGFSERTPGLEFRRLARIVGIPVALIALLAMAEFWSEFSSEVGRSWVATHKTSYLVQAGFLLVFVGCVVGWVKDLAASLFILTGILIILVTALAFPGSVLNVLLFAIPALPGFLYLCAHLASKKK